MLLILIMAAKGSIGFCSEEERVGHDMRACGAVFQCSLFADDPSDLSISLKGGEETNKDFLSSGE